MRFIENKAVGVLYEITIRREDGPGENTYARTRQIRTLVPEEGLVMCTNLVISTHRKAVFTYMVRHAAGFIVIRRARSVWRRDCGCDLLGNRGYSGASCPPGRATAG